jgi:hypothetical protein
MTMHNRGLVIVGLRKLYPRSIWRFGKVYGTRNIVIRERALINEDGVIRGNVWKESIQDLNFRIGIQNKSLYEIEP